MEPITRVEQFLAKAAGMTSDCPEPITRVEKFLQKIAANGGGGNANIDVTAAVGQTIRVKAVDENGKPTEWEAVDYQKKICGDELAYIIPETTIEGSSIETTVDELLVEGETYVVNWEGVDYTCECFAVSGDGVTITFIGNSLAFDGENTGEPFDIGTTVVDGINLGIVMATDDTVTSFTFSVKGEVAIPIPAPYVTNALPYYIEVTGSGTDDDPFVCNDTVANVEAIYNSGRAIISKIAPIYGIEHLIPLTMYARPNSEGIYAHGAVLEFYFQQGSGKISKYLIPQEDGTYAVSESATG